MHHRGPDSSDAERSIVAVLLMPRNDKSEEKGTTAKARKLAAKKRRKEREQRELDERRQHDAAVILQNAVRKKIASGVLAVLRYEARTPEVILKERSEAWLAQQRHINQPGYGIVNVVSAKAAALESRRYPWVRKREGGSSSALRESEPSCVREKRIGSPSVPPVLPKLEAPRSRIVRPQPGFASSMSSNRAVERFIELSKKTGIVSEVRSPKRNRSPLRRTPFVQVHDEPSAGDGDDEHAAVERPRSPLWGVGVDCARRASDGLKSGVRRISKEAKDLLSA